MSDAPCDVGPMAEQVYIWQQGIVEATNGNLPPRRHHPAGIEPPELYEQWREMGRAKERDLMASCPDVKSYIQACRYMAGPSKPFSAYDVLGVKPTESVWVDKKPEPFQAEGAVFARLIAKG